VCAGLSGLLGDYLFLAGPGRKAVMLVQAFVDLATCVLAAGVAARLAAGKSEARRERVAAAALWLTALCPFTANYAAVPLTEVLATFFTTLAILIFFSPYFLQINLVQTEKEPLRAFKPGSAADLWSALERWCGQRCHFSWLQCFLCLGSASIALKIGENSCLQHYGLLRAQCSP